MYDPLAADGLVLCPYCGEPIELTIDEDGGAAQDYVEDCAVCCRPIAVGVAIDEEGGVYVEARRLDD